MIIINFMGGLGNQMFQYALYKKIEISGKTVYADKVLFYHDIEKRKFELEIFGIELEEANENDNIALRGKQTSLIDIIRRKYNLIKTYYREKKIEFNPNILQMDNVYLDGYWQSEKYFKDISGELKKIYVFPPIQIERYQEYAKKIEKNNSVSIHVRRGDYVKNSKMYGGICTQKYYQRAINIMEHKIENPMFFVFSDDIEWAREHFEGEQYQFIEKELEECNYIDMQLMSLCKHNIIANSSFSWWGAWLNSNEDKIVVVPKKWLRDIEVNDIWCDGWILI